MRENSQPLICEGIKRLGCLDKKLVEVLEQTKTMAVRKNKSFIDTYFMYKTGDFFRKDSWNDRKMLSSSHVIILS